MLNFVLKGGQISVLLMGFDNILAVLDPCESTQCVNGDCTTLLTSSDPVCVCAEYYSGDLCETRMSFCSPSLESKSNIYPNFIGLISIVR